MRGSTPFLVVVFACGAVMGAVAGLIAGGRGGSADERIVPETVQAAQHEAGTAAGAAAETLPDKTGEGRKAPPADDSDALLKALLAIPVPAHDKGSGAITGRVLTASGKPVQGVLVRASRAEKNRAFGADFGDGSPPEEADLETRVKELVLWHRTENATREEASTNGGGGFVLKGLADCEYWVLAFKKGYEISRKNASRKGTSRPGDVVDFTAAMLAEVRVSVLLPDGSQAGKATIEVKRKGKGQDWSHDSKGWSGEHPSIHLKPGSYSLVAETEEQDGLRSAEQDVEVGEDSAARDVTLALKEPVGIKGRIALPEGMEMEHIFVRYMNIAPSAQPDMKMLLRQGKFVVMSSGDPTFSIKDLAPGTYLVGAANIGHKVVAHCTVQVTDRMAEAVLSPPPLKPEDYVVVRVFDPLGNPLQDVKFEVGVGDESYSTMGPAMWIRQKDGSFWVFNYASDMSYMPVPKQPKYSLKAISAKYGEKQTEYDPSASREVVFRFIVPATIEVSIGGYKDSEFVGRLSLELRQRDEKEEGARSVSRVGGRGDEQKGIDAEGRQTLGPVEPGEYDLVLNLGSADSWGNTIPIRKTPVSLGAGANSATVRIPPRYQLTVSFEKAGKGEQVMVGPADAKRRWGGWNMHKEIGEDGKAVFDKLPEGKYRLQKWGGSDAGSMEIVLPGQSNVLFKPKPVNALRVTVTDPSGVLGRAGLETGDLIIGLDSTEFQNMAHMQMLLYASMGKEKTALMLLRGGSKTSVEIETAKLFNPGSEDQLGGDVEEVSRD